MEINRFYTVKLHIYIREYEEDNTHIYNNAINDGELPSGKERA